MYIGNLNDRAPLRAFTLTGESGVPLTAGNPFAGETLSVNWRQIVPFGLTMQLDFADGLWLDSIVLGFAAKSAPTAVTLLDTAGRVLDAYRGETGRPITAKQIVLHFCDRPTTLLLHIDTDLADVILESAELWGALLSDEPTVYPKPASSTYTGAYFPLAAYPTASADCAEGKQALAILREKLAELTGQTLTETDSGKITFTRDLAIPTDGYRLTVDADRVAIAAADLRGFVLAAETFLKLIRGGEVADCQIEDAPFLPFRGVHLYIPAPDQLDFTRRLIKYLLSPMGYNVIIFEVAGAMRFKRHPEINAAVLEANRMSVAGKWPPFAHGEVAGRQITEQEDLRELCAYARSFGIDVVPEVQSLGHVQFMTHAHPEIAERSANAVPHAVTDDRLADIPPDEFYPHCYCPSNPRSYEILFDLYDEIIDTFEPRRFVHIGHDEVYRIGVCPTCSQRDPAELFEEDVRRIYDYLKAKGLTPMMWADMLQPVTKYKTPAARHNLPRDIVMLDFIWYFHLDRDIEDNLLGEGYRVAVGNLYSSHFPRYESRIRKPGMLGGEVSAWVSTAEDDLSREGKLYDMLFTAGMLWSADYASHARYAYDRIISAAIPTLRENLRGVASPSLHPHTALPIELDTALPANTRLDSLVIEHTATRARHRETWKPFAVIGQYTVTYADGGTKTIPVTYGGNIGYIGRRQHAPLPHPFYRHNGYLTAWETDGLEVRDATGSLNTTYRTEWRNPRPDTPITAVRYAGDGDVIVRRILGIQSK